MINDPRFINDFGLLNAKEADINAENAPLWSLERLLLEHDEKMFQSLIVFIDSCRTSEAGLFNQAPVPAEGKDGYMSPDQLIAFVGALKMANRHQAVKNIWKYLYKHLFTYDNLKPGKTNFDRIMQPSAVLYIGVMAGHSSLKPLLSIALIYSCLTNRKETSGKLKAWVMFKSAKMKVTEKICDVLIKTNSYLRSWPGVFKEYFQEEGHPNPELAKNLYS